MNLQHDELDRSIETSQARFSESSALRRNKFAKRALLLAAIGICLASFWLFRDQLSIEAMVASETELRNFAKDHPFSTMFAGWFIYSLVTGLSIPGATLLTLGMAWTFGFWRALLTVSLGSTTGATIAFLISRYLFRNWVEEKMQGRHQAILDRFKNDGAYYLFSLRLTPVVPFFLINLLMGVTQIRTSTFWWVSQLGMLPATLVYVYAGSTLPSLSTLTQDGLGSLVDWRLLFAFCLLGLLPISLKKIMGYLERGRAVTPSAD